MSRRDGKPLRSAYSYRAQSSYIVALIAVVTGESQAVIWQRLYARLETAFGIRIHAYPRERGETLLSVAQRNGLLNELYAIAYAEHLYLHACQL